VVPKHAQEVQMTDYKPMPRQQEDEDGQSPHFEGVQCQTA